MLNIFDKKLINAKQIYLQFLICHGKLEPRRKMTTFVVNQEEARGLPLIIKYRKRNMIDKNIIKEIVEQAIAGSDIFLVDVAVTPANAVTVELDSMKGLDIETCARITREIESRVDRDIEDYELEVGSAGLTAPFKVTAQYVKNIGNDIEVLTRDGRKLTGRLVEVNEPSFTIEITRKVKEPGAKRPTLVTEPITLSMDNVKKACYLIDFK